MELVDSLLHRRVQFADDERHADNIKTRVILNAQIPSAAQINKKYQVKGECPTHK